jgi:hypothetical protein
MFRMFLL